MARTREPGLAELPAERLPKRLDPMLAKVAALPEGEEWAYEIKWDGVRALVFAEPGLWCMQSRRHEDVTARYPELEGIAEQLGDRAAVLDGEVVAFDERGRPSFQAIQQRMGLTSAGVVEQRMAQTPVTFIAFDLLHLDGRSTRELSYDRRRELLERIGLDGPHWQTPRNNPGPGAQLLDAARERGLEGVVAKRRDSPYRTGKRTGEWIKARVWRRQEFVIGGWIPGEGSRAERVGSLLVGFYEDGKLAFAGAVGSGLKEEDIDFLTKELKKRRREQSPFDVGAPRGPKAKLALYCEPELVCEVSWTEWTRAGTLRQPAFKAMRDDKDPREVVRES
ncbi:MAG: non-homologous end-joining DNA ligase [Solirubrobacterales bacterium]